MIRSPVQQCICGRVDRFANCRSELVRILTWDEASSGGGSGSGANAGANGMMGIATRGDVGSMPHRAHAPALPGQNSQHPGQPLLFVS